MLERTNWRGLFHFLPHPCLKPNYLFTIKTSKSKIKDQNNDKVQYKKFKDKYIINAINITYQYMPTKKSHDKYLAGNIVQLVS